ncbi:hypothetical protein MKX01_002307 [Papaver californicum]|nr:hypothetical protein MKX01_002307 [Papaver californicum]
MFPKQSTVDKDGENVANAAQAAKDYVTGADQSKKEETLDSFDRMHWGITIYGMQTGTTVVNTTQGAVETVKNTVGMNRKISFKHFLICRIK